MHREQRDSPRNRYKAPAVHKAFRLLRTVAEAQRGVRIVDLAARLGYSISSTHGLVHALLREGALIQRDDSHKVFLGPLISDLAFIDWNYAKIHELTQPIINGIRDRTGATVLLGARIQTGVMITAVAEAAGSLKISAPVGTQLPFSAGAVGKVFLAQETAARVRELAGEPGLPHFTPHSILNMEEYLLGIRSIAAALGNRRGLPLAVWVVEMTSNLGETKLQYVAAIIVAAAKRLRSQLEEAGRPWGRP